MIRSTTLTTALQTNDLAQVQKSARALLVRPGIYPKLVFPTTAWQFAALKEIVQIANNLDDPQNLPARSFLSRHFLELFQHEGRAAIDFGQSLVRKYLAGPNRDNTLLFWRSGARPLEELTCHLSPPDQQTAIKGLHISNEQLMERRNHPSIIETLFQEGVLDRPRIVFIDNGYVGSLARRTIGLLQNEQLLRYVEEERQITLPRHEWQFAAAMLYLVKNSGNPPCPISGHNYEIGQPNSEHLNQLVFLLDEGINFKEEKGSGQESLERRLFIQALIEAASAVPL
jgi:hypothetical protein